LTTGLLTGHQADALLGECFFRVRAGLPVSVLAHEGSNTNEIQKIDK